MGGMERPGGGGRRARVELGTERAGGGGLAAVGGRGDLWPRRSGAQGGGAGRLAAAVCFWPLCPGLSGFVQLGGLPGCRIRRGQPLHSAGFAAAATGRAGGFGSVLGICPGAQGWGKRPGSGVAALGAAFVGGGAVGGLAAVGRLAGFPGRAADRPGLGGSYG